MSKEKEKRGPGRPRVRPAEPVVVRCEVSPADAETVRDAAFYEGVSMSVFARRELVKAARRVIARRK